MLLKKYAGEEGGKVDVQKLFGYIGFFTLVALWWLGKKTFCPSIDTISINSFDNNASTMPFHSICLLRVVMLYDESLRCIFACLVE